MTHEKRETHINSRINKSLFYFESISKGSEEFSGALSALKTIKKMSEDFDSNFGDDTDEQETLRYYLEMFEDKL